MMQRHYHLRCMVCGATFEDDGFTLTCPHEHAAGLLVTEYATRQFEQDTRAEGLYRYRSWLPALRELSGVGCGVTYRSERLCRLAGLPNLWIAFNGYWPEKGATLTTATFKELESFAVLARIPERQRGVLVVASAGNTAAAFAYTCSCNKLPCVIVIPESGLQRMRFAEPLDACVTIVSVAGFSDYFDAIMLSEQLARVEGFIAEGGVKNVARRDGIGTTLLRAVETIGRLPDYYFQAIGSGAGGIAIHQAALRLVEDGRFGRQPPRQLLSQNIPFAPIYRSWKAQERELLALDEEEGKRQLQQIVAGVLSNRRPPYTLRGGVFDVLSESQGDMLEANNAETLAAVELFREHEGIDIDPAAGVALATLLKAAGSGRIDPEALVLLHITGGGQARREAEQRLVPAQPALWVDAREIASGAALEQCLRMF